MTLQAPNLNLKIQCLNSSLFHSLNATVNIMPTKISGTLNFPKLNIRNLSSTLLSRNKL